MSPSSNDSSVVAKEYVPVLLVVVDSSFESSTPSLSKSMNTVAFESGPLTAVPPEEKFCSPPEKGRMQPDNPKANKINTAVEP